MWKLLVHYRHLFIISFSLSESVELGFWLWSAPSWLSFCVWYYPHHCHCCAGYCRLRRTGMEKTIVRLPQSLCSCWQTALPQLKEWLWCPVSVSRSVVSDSLRLHGLSPTRLLCPGDFPGKNTGVGCHSLLWRIFPTQGSNLYYRQILHCLNHQGSGFDIFYSKLIVE